MAGELADITINFKFFVIMNSEEFGPAFVEKADLFVWIPKAVFNPLAKNNILARELIGRISGVASSV